MVFAGLISLATHIFFFAVLRPPSEFPAAQTRSGLLQVRLNVSDSSSAIRLGGEIAPANDEEVFLQGRAPLPVDGSAVQPQALSGEPTPAASVDKLPPEKISGVSAPVSEKPVPDEAAKRAEQEAARRAMEERLAPYRGVGLDPPPRPIGEIDPAYPEAAGKRQGAVRVTLLVNEEGIVDDAIVIYSRPAGMFDEAAVDAFRSARFTPGRFLGIPVKSRLTVEVEFTPINRGGAVAGRGY